MVDDVGQRIVRFDLMMACVVIATGFMVALSMGIQSNDIVAGATVALATAVLYAGADRSRLGLRVFVAIGAFVIAGLVAVIAGLVTTGTESWIFAVIPGGMVGLGLGWLLNRVLFGVVWSVPKARVERGFGWTR